MSRVKSGVVTHARHRKVIKKAKGYYAARSTNFVNALAKAGIEVDRKVLADLAVHEPAAFEAIVGKAKAALA